MKHIKKYIIYEGKGVYPRENNYVICNTSIGITWNGTTTTQQHLDYLQSHVGQIIEVDKLDDNPYNVRYDNVPEFMKELIQNYDGLWFNRYEISHFSTNKDEMLKIAYDAKIKIEMYKFNL
jgi:hypothetical protein